jgi:hypothetical protein
LWQPGLARKAVESGGTKRDEDAIRGEPGTDKNGALRLSASGNEELCRPAAQKMPRNRLAMLRQAWDGMVESVAMRAEMESCSWKMGGYTIQLLFSNCLDR